MSSSFLPLSSSTLKTLAQSTAHRDAAEKLISSQTNPRALLDELVSVLEVNDSEKWNSKDRIKSLVVLSNFAMLESLKSDILRAFKHTSASFETLLSSKEQASKDFGGKKATPEHMLVCVLLLRILDYNLKAADLLDLLNNNVKSCLALIEALLKSSYELPLVVGLTKCLGEFCHPSTYFDSQRDGNDRDSGKRDSNSNYTNERSCQEFTERVNELIQHLMGRTLLSSLASAVQQRVNRLARSKEPTEDEVVMTSTLVRHSVVFLLNSYIFLSKNPATFRQHLVVGIHFPKLVIVPFLSNVVLPVFERIKTKTKSTHSLVRTTEACIQLLSILYYRLNGNPSANEHILRNMNLTTKIMQSLATNIVHHPKLVALMILFHSNVDSLGPIHTTLSLETENWANDSSPRILYQVFEEVVLFFRSNDISRGRLIHILENPEPLPIARDTETLQKLCALVESIDEDGQGEEDEEDEEDDDGGDDGDDGGDDGEEMKMDNGKQKTNPLRPGFGSSNRRFRLLGDLPTFHSHKDKESEAQNAIQRKRNRRQKREKKKRNVREGAKEEKECPKQFRCSIDGCLMRVPVRTAAGLYFEKETIETWLNRCGSICPITGEKLTVDDLQFDKVMADSIQRYCVGKVLKNTERKVAAEYESKNNTETVAETWAANTTSNIDGFANDDDLYVF